MTVVGTAVVNSTDEGSPGLGAVLCRKALGAAASALATTFVVDLWDVEPGRSARTELEASFEGASLRAGATTGRAQPGTPPPCAWLLAAIVVVLAAEPGACPGPPHRPPAASWRC